jgi:hypothetical protein
MKPILIAAVALTLCNAAHATDSFYQNEIKMNGLTERSRSLSEFSSQERQQRARPRIRIQPNQPPAWDYPRPGEYSWPGPGAVRQCVGWYATEYRPSGTVITPQQRCRWVRG